MSYTQAAFGLEFLRAVSEDGRMSRDELVEIIQFAANSFGEAGMVDKVRAAHAVSLLCDGFVSSRGSRVVGSFGRDPYADLDQPSARGRIDAKATAAAIIKAHEKARGEAVVELPSDPVARAVVIADMRRRGDPPYRRAQSEPVHIDGPTAVAAKIIAAAARGEK